MKAQYGYSVERNISTKTAEPFHRRPARGRIKNPVILAAAVLILMFVGCKKEDPAALREGATPEDLEARKQRMETEKQELYEEMKTRLDNLEEKISDLRVQARRVEGERRREFEERIDQLERKQVDIRLDLDRIKSAGIEVWEDLKPRVRSALDDLTEGIERAISQFRFSEPDVNHHR